MLRLRVSRPSNYLLIAITFWLLWMQLYWHTVDNVQLFQYIPMLQTVPRLSVNLVALYYLYRCIQQEDSYRVTFLFFIFSFINLSVAGLMYDYVNLFSFNYLFSIGQRYIYRMSMVMHLICHSVAWLSLLLRHQAQSRYYLNLYLPYLLTFLIIGVALSLSDQWYSLVLGNDEIASVTSFKFTAKLMQNIVNIYCLIVISLFFSRAIKPWAKHLVLGSFIMNSPNIFVYHYNVQSFIRYFSTTDMLIILGAMLMIAGLKAYIDMPADRNRGISPVNSLRSQTTAWLSSIMYFSLIMIIVSAKIMSDHNFKQLYTLDTIITVLVVCALFTSLISIVLSQFVSYQFVKITRLIEQFSFKNENTEVLSSTTQISELNALEDFIEESYHLKNTVDSKNKALTEHALKVAHDLRSPLIVLKEIFKANQSNMSTSDAGMIRSSISTIQDITERILNYHRQDTKRTCQNSAFVYPLLISLIRDVKTCLNGKQIDFSVTKHVLESAASINATDFKRVMMNILKNAVESIDEQGDINITISESATQVEISVQDTGQGIANDLLPMIYDKTISTKVDGTGLGLSITKQILHYNHGEIRIRSKEHIGTTALVTLPKSLLPNIYLTTIKLHKGDTVVVYSDDVELKDLLQCFFQKLSCYQDLSICMIDDINDLKEFEKPVKHFLIGQAEFTTIDNLKVRDFISNTRELIVCVDDPHDEDVLRCIADIGGKCLPKAIVNEMRYEILADLVILFDDSAELGHLWQLAGLKRSITVQSFTSYQEFRIALDKISKDTPIYIDVDLGDALSGIDVSREISRLGFTRIYLTTAHDPAKYHALAWIQGVIGKTPPFAPDEAYG